MISQGMPLRCGEPAEIKGITYETREDGSQAIRHIVMGGCGFDGRWVFHHKLQYISSGVVRYCGSTIRLKCEESKTSSWLYIHRVNWMQIKLNLCYEYFSNDNIFHQTFGWYILFNFTQAKPQTGERCHSSMKNYPVADMLIEFYMALTPKQRRQIRPEQSRDKWYNHNISTLYTYHENKHFHVHSNLSIFSVADAYAPASKRRVWHSVSYVTGTCSSIYIQGLV